MKRCNDKEDDVCYPTTDSIHIAIKALPEITWTWTKATTYWCVLSNKICTFHMNVSSILK